MTENTIKRSTAIIRQVANMCKECLRNDEYNCQSCVSMSARSILIEIENEKDEQKEIDYSIYARMATIKNILEESNRPLLSHEININGLCSHQLKLFTLKKMVKLGILGRRVAFRKKRKNYFFYFLKKNNKETTK